MKKLIILLSFFPLFSWGQSYGISSDGFPVYFMRNGMAHYVANPCNISIDIDARPYISKSGISSCNFKHAVNNLVIKLKSDGVWDDLHALYQFEYDSLANLINIKDTSKYKLTQIGTFSRYNYKIKPVGNSYFKTGLVAGTVLSGNDASFGIYTDTMKFASSFNMGCKDATNLMYFIDNYNITYGSQAYMYGIAYGVVGERTEKGLYSVTREAATSLKIYNNQHLLTSKAGGGGGTIPIIEMYVGGVNNNNGTPYYNSKPFRFAYVANGLSAAQVEDLSDALRNFRITAEQVATDATITIYNQNNPESFTNYPLELNLDNTDLDIWSIKDGTDLRFYDGVTELDYFVDYIDKYADKARIIVKVNLAANANKTITIFWNVSGTTAHKVNFEDILQRRYVADSATSLYTFYSIADSLDNGNDATLNGGTLSSVTGVGSVLSLDGVNDSTTIVADLPTIGYVGFNFILPKIFTGIGYTKTIFSKYIDANNYIYLDLISTGAIRINARANGNATGYTLPYEITTANRINYFGMRLTENYIIYTLNDHKYGVRRPLGTGGRPFTFGCLNNGAMSQFCEVKIFDFEIADAEFDIKDEMAHNKSIANIKDNESKKWTKISEFPSWEPDDTLRQEPTIVDWRDTLWVYYYFDDHDLNKGIKRVYSVDNGVTWSGNQSTTGIPGQLPRPFIYIENDTMYCFVTDQSDGNFIFYKSTNGISFTYAGIAVDSTFGIIENIFIMYDSTSNVYRGWAGSLVSAGYWKGYPIQGTSLYALDYTTASYPASLKYTDKNSISPVIKDMIGVNRMARVGNYFYIWTVTNPPNVTWLMVNKSGNHSTDAWEFVHFNESFTLDSPFGSDQKCGIQMCLKGGKIYAVVNNSTETPVIHGNFNVYEYNGDFEDLLSNPNILIQ